MTNTENTNKNKDILKIVIAFLVGVGLIYGVATFVVSERVSEIELETKLLISEQETLLATIAETTARNGADEITERIIRDCSLTERNSFDNLLSRLNDGLTQTQLIELERLFGRCGNFFAERKSVMVSRLQREIEIYATFVEQLENLTNRDVAQYQVPQWQELARLEVKQSELFSSLVVLQDQIISSLLAGNSAGSEEVTQILQEVTETQETLIVTRAQASNIRSSLVSL